MNTRTRIMTAATAILLCGTAFAQHAEGLEGRLDQPLTAAQPASSGSSHITMTSTEDGTTYKVEIKDGKTTASIDGKTIPAKRIKQSDGLIEILGEDGEVLKEFHVGTAQAPRALAFRGSRGGTAFTLPSAPIAPQPPTAVWGEMVEPPKTMIGIRMDDEAEGDVILTDVVENLPAAKAGLQAGDVLVTIAGMKIAKVTDVRESIKDKVAGDKVEFVVRRDGAEKKFTLTLDAWNTEKLYVGMPEDEMTKLRGALEVAGQDTGRFAEEARVALEKALKEIQSSESKAQFEKSWSDAMKQAMKALEQTKAESGRWLQGFAAPAPVGGSSRVFTRSGQGGVYTLATPEPSAHSESTHKRLEELNARLDDLSTRLDKLMEKLEKKNP